MKERWTNRTAFIFAMIGAAVWLWNARRFPWLCAEFWGWAFIIAYIICMLAIWMPLLMLETAIGRKTHKSAPLALKALDKKAEPLGWSAIGNAFFVTTYYAVVFWWCIMMCLLCLKFANVAGTTETASSLWQNTIWTTFTTDLSNGWWITNPIVLWCLIVAWLFIYWSIRKGTKYIEKVTKFTVIIPIITLLILAIKGFIGNPHLWEALSALFIPNFNSFLDIDLWANAIGHSLYSLSIMLGIAYTYWAYLKKEDSNIAVDTVIVSLVDLGISILASIVLFTTMYSTGLSIDNMSASWIATAFIIYPTAIVNLTSSWVLNAIFWFIFYFTLCTLAIDSAFALLEAVSHAVSDKLKVDKRKTTRVLAVIMAILWIIYTTKAWVAFVDIVDHRTNQYAFIIVGLLEAIFVGRLIKPQKVLDEINLNTKKFSIPKWWFYTSIKILAPIASIFLIALPVRELIKNGWRYDTNYSLTSEIILWWCVIIVILSLGYIINYILRHTKNWQEILELENKEPTRDEIKE